MNKDLVNVTSETEVVNEGFANEEVTTNEPTHGSRGKKALIGGIVAAVVTAGITIAVVEIKKWRASKKAKKTEVAVETEETVQ